MYNFIDTVVLMIYLVCDQGYAELKMRDVAKCKEEMESDTFDSKIEDSFDDRRKSW